jgi:miniconductance mechanosensitive channel
MNSIRFCDDAMLARLNKIELLQDYLCKKTEEVAAYNRLNEINDSNAVNGRKLTNLGTFSAYLSTYLRHHPKVNASMRLIIRYLQPTVNGLPIEILVFSIEKEWAIYEHVQADIIDHMIAILPYFELRVFQNPGSYDIQQSSKTQDRTPPE